MRLRSNDTLEGILPSVPTRGERTTIARLGAGVSIRASAQPALNIPAPVLVLISSISLEFGGALAKTLFASLGPLGTVTLRGAIAAIVVLLLWRPRMRRIARSSYWMILLFGLDLAAMNLCFYLALSRVPLAVAVTIELVGPLIVSALGSRCFRHALWVLLAAAGIFGFAPIGALGGAVDPLGIGLALLSAFFCAMYILLSAGVGRTCERGDGLALAMAVAAIALLPPGIVADGGLLLQPRLMIPAAGVALLCSVVPYSLEIEALRRMPPRVFGVLVSLEPAFASLAGWIVLHERLSLRALVAIALVTLASVGAASSERVGICSPTYQISSACKDMREGE